MSSPGTSAARPLLKVCATWSTLIWLTVFSGCAPRLQPRPPMPTVTAPPVETGMNAPRQAAEEAPNGSLWREDVRIISLYETPKARDVGNILTVRIVESSSAKNSATTTTGRNSSISAGIDQFFTLEEYITPYTRVSGSLESDFEGNGSTDRSGRLMATITVRVVAVLPDGNLKIAGSREVAVNNEKQIIALTGFVRPEDIDHTNTILSTDISDARIAYSGIGIVNDRQRPGWMMRTLDAIWPF